VTDKPKCPFWATVNQQIEHLIENLGNIRSRLGCRWPGLDNKMPLEHYHGYSLLPTDLGDGPSSNIHYNRLPSPTMSGNHHDDYVEPLKQKASQNSAEIIDDPTINEPSDRVNWRATTWLTTFYLLTTDVLGPSGAPWSISKFGYAPGAVLFISMGCLAAYSSILLWRMFLRLDSLERPIRTWRDIGDRLCGSWFGHLITAMQSLQMFLGVAIVLLGNAQSLSQIIQFRLCFVVISLLLTALGAAIGCIRTFRRLSLFATFSVFGIIAICIITMASTSHTYPYFGDGSPVKTEVVRRDVDFQTQLVAAMNMVNAYGGKSTSAT